MKDEIISFLKENSGKYISGEQLSASLNVSRAAVWKVIKQLKAQGYLIDSKSKLGYKLVLAPDCLYPNEIKPLLNTKEIGQEIIHADELSSTNDYAKALAQKPFLEGTAVICEFQNKGRGRIGREWISPKGKGINMSILIKPKLPMHGVTIITLLTALSVCRAIEAVANVSPQIKWPNDIMLNGKKLCGILTEANGEIDHVNYLAIGIGLNVNVESDELGSDLRKTATSLLIETGQEHSRKTIVAEILNSFEKYYYAFIKGENIIDEYKIKCMNYGKKINLVNNGVSTGATAIDILENGTLLVKLDSGEIKEIMSGEISVRQA